MFFKKQEIEATDSVQERLDTIIELVKDLQKSDFDRLTDAMALIWQGYDKVRKIEDRVQKESRSDMLELEELGE